MDAQKPTKLSIVLVDDTRYHKLQTLSPNVLAGPAEGL